MENKKVKFFYKYKLEEKSSLLAVLLILIYFFYGFFSNEISAGAGGYDGDFKLIWSNLQILREGIILNLDNPDYSDSRPPLSYILHILVNPFIDNQESYRSSVFIVSLLVPVLLFFSVKEKFKQINNYLALLIASIITLSPYFRTSSYWGLGENYGLIFCLSSYLIFSNFKKNIQINNLKNNILLIFLLCLNSSLIVYFDQKLVFIPLYIFSFIIFSNYKLDIKFLTLFFYSLFAVPYIYLISLWGSIIPTQASHGRDVGDFFNLYQLGYCITIIAFYIFPFLFCKYLTFKNLKTEILSVKFLSLIITLAFYIIILILFYNFGDLRLEGKGIVHKFLINFVENENLRFYFTVLSFLIGAVIIFIFFEKKNDFIIISYFLTLSIVTFPFYQEYLDPLILLLIFTFFDTKIRLTFKKTYLITIYFFGFLMSANIYYNYII
tara:strand:- start:2435 stop:3748 length:1314 start_codon:yes stop_codon:yes gene_type:complete